MKFLFKLQPLLNWKESLKEASRMALAKKNYQLRKQEGEIEILKTQREDQNQEIQDSMKTGVMAWEFLFCQLFQEKTYEDLKQKEGSKKKTELEAQQERKRLIGLMMEKKILERLREKRFNLFLKEQNRQAQKELDEISIGTYNKKARVCERQDFSI